MLSKKQIKEIQETLNNAQNPLFLFDNDQDGLCSFLILQRYIERGKGFPVKSLPLDESYFRKIEELKPDCLFILDTALVTQNFFDKIKEINLPVVWIDHHDSKKIILPENIKYYNPIKKKNIPSSTSYLCYEVTKKKQDLWLTILGCLSDKFIPPEYEEFKKIYPDLSFDSKEAFDIVYNSDIGKISQILGCGLKDRTTNVIKMIKFLMKVKTPYEILEENSQNKEMHEKFKEISQKYEKILNKAKEKAQEEQKKLFFFEYGGETSMSSEISNRLKHLYPEKIVFVAYVSEGFVNISGRGKNVKKILEKALKNIENARGGGHKDAVGGRIMRNDLEKFKKAIEKIVEKNQ